jgi:Concanavalin A-like lectin/glucanases superfamily
MSARYAARFTAPFALSNGNAIGQPAVFSVGAWLNYPDATIVSSILSNTGSPFSTGWTFGTGQGGAGKGWLYLSGTNFNTLTSLSASTWHYLFGTYDNSGGTPVVKLYLDGVLDNTSNVPITYPGSPLTANFLGGLDFAPDQPVAGRIAAVGVWNVVRTAGDVAALFNAGKGLGWADLPTGLRAGCISYYDFSNGSALGTDQSGSGADFTHANGSGSVAQDAGPGYVASGPFPFFIDA